MMQLRIVGETKINIHSQCPYCKGCGKRAGSTVEIVVDESTGLQYASYRCDLCKEQVLAR